MSLLFGWMTGVLSFRNCVNIYASLMTVLDKSFPFLKRINDFFMGEDLSKYSVTPCRGTRV